MFQGEVFAQPEGHPRWHHRHSLGPEASAIKLIASSLLFLILILVFVVQPWWKKRRRAKRRPASRRVMHQRPR